MNRRLIRFSTPFLVLFLISSGLIACGQEYDDPVRFRNPSNLSSYGARIGYYKINPETILSDLEQGKTDVFTPLAEDPSRDYELDSIEISWTQADFLKIASAVGQLAWDDPMDLNNWSVYFIILQGSCQDTPRGFSYAGITYFKLINLNAENYYETRRIEINPHFSAVGWGSGATYPQSAGDWKGVNLTRSTITADEALRIADENGGKDVRMQSDSCTVYVDSSIDINNMWYLSYFATPSLNMYIDMETGEYELKKSNQK